MLKLQQKIWFTRKKYITQWLNSNVVFIKIFRLFWKIVLIFIIISKSNVFIQPQFMRQYPCGPTPLVTNILSNLPRSFLSFPKYFTWQTRSSWFGIKAGKKPNWDDTSERNDCSSSLDSYWTVVLLIFHIFRHKIVKNNLFIRQ